VPATPPGAAGAAPAARRSLAAAFAVGVGAVAAFDLIVFHQLLGWHHLDDRSTLQAALRSDGLLHVAELVVLVGGLLALAAPGRRRAPGRGLVWAGILLGAGAFQLFDGVVTHKLLGLHQVRYGVDPLPYDLAWNGAGALLLLAGAALAWRARDEIRRR
jgi:uncharacterized membrane protein